MAPLGSRGAACQARRPLSLRRAGKGVGRAKGGEGEGFSILIAVYCFQFAGCWLQRSGIYTLQGPGASADDLLRINVRRVNKVAVALMLVIEALK